MKTITILPDYSKSSFFNDGSLLFTNPKSKLDDLQDFGFLEMKYLNRQINVNIFISGSVMKIKDQVIFNIQQKYERYFDLENINVKKALHSKTQQLGFRLSRNGQYAEFYGNIMDIWKYLKKYAIQTDFHLKYKLGKKIGDGFSSSVYKASKIISNQNFAVKIVEKSLLLRGSSYEKFSLLNELSILRKINHKNLLELEETFENDENLYIVTELLEGGPLKNQIFKYRFSEQETIVLMQTLFESLNYLHQHNIYHQDIKFDNILLRDDSDLTSACFINFGKAEGLTSPLVSSTNLSFTQYDKNYKEQYFRKKDIYALGIIILSIFAKKLYQENQLLDELMMKNYQNMSDIEFMNLIAPLQHFFEILFTEKTNQQVDLLTCDDILQLDVFKLSFQRRNSKIIQGIQNGLNLDKRRSTRFIPRASQREYLQPQERSQKLIRLPTISDSCESKIHVNSSFSPASENYISSRFLNQVNKNKLLFRKSILKKQLNINH